ncbi:hypothetical protein BD289DRAFT_484068 [Coniella lustricola]|uniref:Transcription factor domain-containing protein n=1 Tax=Coniella lustricola TaxID=2025994 RepID=A0A2T3A372_9PEZI|nr:hypothetical protein BD289DRAFT_484068 [Coniella lustricola]
MSLLNASQQIQQSSPSSSGHTPPSSTPAVPAWEHHRNSIHQLLNHGTETQDGAGESGLPDYRPYHEQQHQQDPSSTTTSTPASNLHASARLIPPTGLVQPASVAATDHRDHSTGPPPIATRPMSPPPGLFTRPAATGDYVDIVKGFRVSYLEAERHLDLYRTVHASYFPFVPIPVLMSARELFDRSPFLFRAIIAVTAPQSGDVQAEYRIWFREYVAQHVVVNNERKLEVLQAILVHLAWGEFYFMVDSQATNLMQLAEALMIDLGLNRWPMDFNKANFMLIRDALVSAGNKAPVRKTHSLDEMRAALGVFYVCSLSSTLFRRHNPMMYSSYFQKCCDTLSAANDFDSDRFLVALVKMQQLLNRAADIIPYADDETAARTPYSPFHMALTAARKELDALVREQPAEVECNPLFWTHYHATVCRLFEPVIYIRPPSSSSSSSSSSPSNTASLGGLAGYNDPAQRTAALWQCLSSARDFFTAYAAIPTQNFPCMPFQNMHIAFCLVTTCKLLFLGDEPSGTSFAVAAAAAAPSSSNSMHNTNNNNSSFPATVGGGSGTDPDWNPCLAREAVDFDAICVKIREVWESVERLPAALGRSMRFISPEKTVIAAYKDKIQWMREWYATRTRPRQQHHHPQQQQQQQQQQDASLGLGVGDFRRDNNRGGMMMSERQKAGTAMGIGVNGSSGYAQGDAMDIDYGVSGMMPGALDDTFWQVMLDWSWNPPMDLVEVQ